MIRSWHALLIALIIIVANGYVKALLVPALPYETMTACTVAICTAYITKRIVQKMTVFNPPEQCEKDGQKDI